MPVSQPGSVKGSRSLLRNAARAPGLEKCASGGPGRCDGWALAGEGAGGSPGRRTGSRNLAAATAEAIGDAGGAAFGIGGNDRKAGRAVSAALISARPHSPL